MAISGVMKLAADATLVFKDGTGTPVSKTLDYDTGVGTLSGIQEVLNEIIFFENKRQNCGPPRHGARKRPVFTLQAKATQFSDAGTGTMTDFLLGTGGYSANISTYGSLIKVRGIDITYTGVGTALGDDTTPTFTMNDCVVTDWTWNSSEDGNTFDITFTVDGAITGDIACAQVA